MDTAIITGASRGFGRAVAAELLDHGWHVVVDGRDPDALARAAADLRTHHPGAVTALAGDVTDPDHRRALVAAAAAVGPLRLLVNNAGTLGPSPLPRVAELAVVDLTALVEVNVAAPLALVQEALPLLVAHDGAVVGVTSDAAIEAYPGWGGYGASKAALERLDTVLAVELAEQHPEMRVWDLDPGDMRTDMHQAAFPDEDISDRPPPEVAARAVVRLLAARPPSGRIRADELLDGVLR